MSNTQNISMSQNEHGLEFVTIENEYATAKLSLFGAHLLSFVPKVDQRERLWLSPKTKLDGSRAIRGGIPICWPWFGDYKTSPHYSDSRHNNCAFPAHGFLRTQVWKILSTQQNKQGTTIKLAPTFTTTPGFEKNTQVELVVEIGKTLSLSLITKNQSLDAIFMTAALHTYFSVENIEHVQLDGLSGTYVDKTQSFKRLATPEVYTFSEETDRVHLCQPKTVNIASNKETNVHSKGHDSIVVWNPWKEKSMTMSDMSNDGYTQMLCVETAITQLPGQKIESGQSHCLKQTID